MAYQLWSQDNFSKGELSPFLYGRATIAQFYNALRTAQNVLNYPSGAAGKRFGTLYQTTLTGFTSFDQIFFQIFTYLDICIFQLLFTGSFVYIYLEGILVATVAVGLQPSVVFNLDYTVIGPTFRITGFGFAPLDLNVALNTPSLINGRVINELTISTPDLAGLTIVPAYFTNTGGALPTSNPQIIEGIAYFLHASSSTQFSVYTNATDAKFQTNPITFSDVGTGTNHVTKLNSWTLSFHGFKNVPVYDFTGGYDAIAFSYDKLTGNDVTLTASSAIFTSEMVGGAFIGGGGAGRIISFTNSTHVFLAMQQAFTEPLGTFLQGSLVLLAEPAWSNKRGWPQKCSSYQNRALFANTVSLPNGFWASVINDYFDFGDLTNDDDDAISWYPSSNDVNVIRFIVPFRSITIHTNTGIYSSPLADLSLITPTTFTLQLQDSTPADILQPQSIDNQIIVISGNDVHTMLWDGINNAYTSNIVSIINEQTIRDPVDESPYADLHRAGSRYVFIVNGNGSLAVYQTLLAESVSGFTPQIMEQSYGSAKFLQTASSADGRCWFVVQREIASAIAPVDIVGFTADTLVTAVNSFSSTDATAATFSAITSLPTTVPPLDPDAYYWIIAPTTTSIKVYLTQEDANAGVNNLKFTDAGVAAVVIGWPLTTIFTMEELTQAVFLDCAVQYNGVPASSITTGALFNAQQVKMVGDGFGFDALGIDNQVVFEEHGELVPVSNAYIGFPIVTIMEPLPLTPPAGSSNTLTKPKHIRSVNFMFNNTIGGTINGVPIALKPFDQADIGEPPNPARGIFEMSIMTAWDDFNKPSFTIRHDEPFNIELIGIFYAVDT